MTVESRQPSFFSPQLWDIELMNSNNNNSFNKNIQFDYFLPSSVPTMAKGTERVLLPKFADSLTLYGVPLLSNKSSYSYFANTPSQERWVSSLFQQIQEQQLDTDRIFTEHMEKVRKELVEKRNIRTKRMIEAIKTTVSKKLKTKDEEIEKIKKLNWFLEEKTKSLNTENQLWREIAQNNEVAANTLRINLEQLWAQRSIVAVEKDADIVPPIPLVIDDAYSCCDSNHEINGNVVESTKKTRNTRDDRCSFVVDNKRLCRNCGKDESCILILPCRHLCLCAVCDFTVNTCPTCKSHISTRIPIDM